MSQRRLLIFLAVIVVSAREATGLAILLAYLAIVLAAAGLSFARRDVAA